MKNPVRLALIYPNKYSHSETFVRAHQQMLDGDIHLLCHSFLPMHSERRGPLVSDKPWAMAWRRIHQFLFRPRFSLHERALLRYLREERIEVAFCEYGPTAAMCTPVLRELGIPLVVIFHGFDAHHEPTVRKYLARYRVMFAYASFIVGVSKKMCGHLVSLGAPREKVVHNPCAPNPVFFEIEPDFAEKTFVGVGRFVDKKGQHITIQAFQKVFEKHSDARLILAGDGPNLEKCKRLAASLGLVAAIEFPGAVSHALVQNYLARGIAYVHHAVTPEHGDSEGTPVAVLEASSAGLPVISTRHGGIPDVVIENETGLLSEELDTGAMTSNMLVLADNLPLAKKMGLNGRRNVQSHFTMQHHIGGLNELIKKAALVSPIPL